MTDHVHWSAITTDSVPFDGQNLTIGFSGNPQDPEGTVTIKGTGTQVLLLPNSTHETPVWEDIPGTSPQLQARQDGHFPSTDILIRHASSPEPVVFTPPAASATQISDGASTGACYPVTTAYNPDENRIYLDGAVANTAGVAIPGGTVLFTVAEPHRPTAWVQFSLRTSTTLSARATLRPDGTMRLDQQLAPGATASFDGLNYRKV